jgi:hypothetical protein
MLICGSTMQPLQCLVKNKYCRPQSILPTLMMETWGGSYVMLVFNSKLIQLIAREDFSVFGL